MKDLFSSQSSEYAQFRPHYPQPLYEALLKHCNQYISALDVATGNGQVASVLSKHFEKVFATDISEQQLKEAIPQPNLIYQVAPAEELPFQEKQFDLITVAQAAHWFEFDKFYKEVERVSKPEAILALWGYDLPKSASLQAINEIIQELYTNKLKDYWEAERKHIDAHYQSIPFAYKEIKMPEMYIEVAWDLKQLEGYLSTWSAVQTFKKRNPEQNPLDGYIREIKGYWPGNDPLTFRFPLFFRVGRIS